MIRHPAALLAALLAGLLASCGTGGDGTSDASSAAGLSLSQRLSQDQGFARDSAGNWVPRSDKRSQYDTHSAANLNSRNRVNPGRYEPGEFRKSEWTRTTSNAPQGYQGDTDGSRFQSTAAAQGQSARQSGSRARTPGKYRTGTFDTGASREDGAARLDRPGDANTRSRRENYVEPEIIDWREQRKLSIGESRSLLAR